MTDNIGGAEFYSAYPERRINQFRPELRSASNGGPQHIWGYASMFNKLSRKLGGFVERVDNRAFNSSKAEGFPGVVARWNHNDDFLLGTTAARTCLVDVDQDGLLYDVVPPSFRSDLVELMDRGDVTSSSFAFRCPEGEGDDWGLSDFGYPLRTLLSVELVDVAPVTTPAYPDATSALRSLDGAVMSLATRFHADPTEIRTLLSNNQGVRLFKRSDVRASAPTAPVADEVPAQGENASWYDEFRKDYKKDARDKMAKAGTAMPDGSFPIADEEDLHNAVKLAGNASDPAAAKAHIKKRAKALGKLDAIPTDWDGGNDSDNASEKKSVDKESEDRAAKAGYADLETCGNCGSTDQFGKHCTNCGNSMEPPATATGGGKFCANCGGKMPKETSKRSEHVCDEEDRDGGKSKPAAKPAAKDDDSNLPAFLQKKKDDNDVDDVDFTDDKDGEPGDDDDEDDTEDTPKSKGKKPPVKGKSVPAKSEKKSADDEDEEVREDEVADGSKARLPGNEVPVGNGEEQLAAAGLARRRMMEALHEKRYDPYLFEDEA